MFNKNNKTSVHIKWRSLFGCHGSVHTSGRSGGRLWLRSANKIQLALLALKLASLFTAWTSGIPFCNTLFCNTLRSYSVQAQCSDILFSNTLVHTQFILFSTMFIIVIPTVQHTMLKHNVKALQRVCASTLWRTTHALPTLALKRLHRIHCNHIHCNGKHRQA